LRNASLPRENSVCRALSMRSKSCHAGGVHCGGVQHGAQRGMRTTQRGLRHRPRDVTRGMELHGYAMQC
jgi:hypothetical protein